MASKDDSDGSVGCLFFVGAAIVAICVGKIYGQVYGWMFLGISLMSMAGFVIFLLALAAIFSIWRKRT